MAVLKFLNKMSILVILFCLISCCMASNSTSKYGELPQPNYEDATYTDSGSLQGLSQMAENFVNIVYPTFKQVTGFVTAILVSDNQVSYITGNWQELAKLEAGFIACVVFGLLFIIFVPLVGLIMCCCRTCCNNCGGKMKQSMPRSKSCWRQCLCVSMLILTILMTVPMVFVFLTNAWIGQVVTDAPQKTSLIISNTLSYVDNVQAQFDYIDDQYNVLDQELRVKVSDLGNSVGEKAVGIANNLADDSLAKLDVLIDEVTIVTTSMEAIRVSVSDLTDGIAVLDTQLSDQSTRMTNGLAACINPTPDVECYGVYELANNLQIPVQPTVLEDFVKDLDVVLDKLKSYDLVSLRQNVTNEINSISDKVSDQTNAQSTEALTYLNSAKAEFDKLKAELPLEQIANYTKQFRQFNSTIFTSVSNYDNNFDQYRYIAGAVLGSLLAVIIACYYIGMIMGGIGFNKGEDPGDRECTSNCGGLWLMSGVGLSFIFSWLLMILVLLTFTIGGHTERYVCQPLSKPYTGLQTLEETIPGFNLSDTLKASGVSAQSIMTDCSNDQSIYNTLQLQNQFDFDQLVADINTQLGEINDTLDNVNVDLTSLEFYDSNVADGLNDVKTSGITTFDFTTAENELNKQLTDPDLSVLAATMNTSAAKYLPASAAEADLTRQYSYELLVIQAEYVDPLQAYVDDVITNINDIKAVQSNIATSVDNLDQALSDFNTNVQNNAAGLIKDAILQVLTEFTDSITEYLNWLVDQIKRNFGACGPVAAAYDQTIGLLCIYFVDTLNGLWFSLGWCVFLLIPSAIVAMKLAKFFRRMDYNEEYEDAFTLGKY